MMFTGSGPLRIEREGPVEWLTLDRPDRMNALDGPLSEALLAYFAGLSRRPEIRVVLMRGAGKAFCAGLDLDSPEIELMMDDRLDRAMAIQRRYSEIILAMRAAPQVVVALINGAAAGAGFVLALASDIRIAARGAWMNAAFIRVGLSGCDMGASYLLSRLVGAAKAAELLFTGRRINGERAEALGLVSEVVNAEDIESAGRSLVEELLASAPQALRLTKSCFNANLDAPSLFAALEVEDRNQILLARDLGFREGVAAFRAKRSPIFRQ